MRNIEEQVAHLVRTVDELNEVVTAQRAEIDRLARQVEMLLHREAERTQEGAGGVILGDERPPHW